MPAAKSLAGPLDLAGSYAVVHHHYVAASQPESFSKMRWATLTSPITWSRSASSAFSRLETALLLRQDRPASTAQAAPCRR